MQSYFCLREIPVSFPKFLWAEVKVPIGWNLGWQVCTCLSHFPFLRECQTSPNFGSWNLIKYSALHTYWTLKLILLACWSSPWPPTLLYLYIFKRIYVDLWMCLMLILVPQWHQLISNPHGLHSCLYIFFYGMYMPVTEKNHHSFPFSKMKKGKRFIQDFLLS